MAGTNKTTARGLTATSLERRAGEDPGTVFRGVPAARLNAGLFGADVRKSLATVKRFNSLAAKARAKAEIGGTGWAKAEATWHANEAKNFERLARWHANEAVGAAVKAGHFGRLALGATDK